MDDWRSEALCGTSTNVRKYFDLWFSEDPRDEAAAKALCLDCPVRAMCLKDQLETQTIHGTRGGLSEDETRQVLSLDENGKEIRRAEFPFCPQCRADTEHLVPTTIDLPDGGRWSVAKSVRCGVCSFEWKSRASHNSVLAYNRDIKKRKEAEDREAAAIRGLKQA